MRFLAKYKNFLRSRLFIQTYPIERILKFKRPKWNKLKVNLTRIKKKQKFYNLDILRAKIKRMEKLRKFVKDCLVTKTGIATLFDDRFSFQYYKKNFTNSKLFFLQCFFRIDILLSKLRLFDSPFEVQHKINQRGILVNGFVIKNVVYLKKGDVVSFCNFNSIVNLKKKVSFLFSFIEIDYYTGNLVILKQALDLQNTEFSVLFRNFISIYHFKNYLSSK